MNFCSFSALTKSRSSPSSALSMRFPLRSSGQTALQPSKIRLSPSCRIPVRPASARSVELATTALSIWQATKRRQIMS